MQKLKVLIADDSVIYRSQIRAALTEMGWIEIVGAASNGRLAIERLQQASVDLLILDLEMPEMDGLQTLAEIAERKISAKVLVFSSASKRGAEITFEALRKGASDFIAKPGADSKSDAEDSKSNGSLTSKADPMKRIRLLLEPKMQALFPNFVTKSGAEESSTMNHLDQQRIQNLPPAMNTYPKVIWDLFKPKVIVIGSSTGGPTVLEKIFSELKIQPNCPILIAQHMPPIFTATLAERLQRNSGIPTCEAKHGMVLQAGQVYVAPGNFHMSLEKAGHDVRIVLDQGPLVNSVRPAVDPLFSSAARIFQERCLGVVLTGMGADGKVGAEHIKNYGGAVVIQSEASCVVFGMPGAVMSAGAFDLVMTPDEIIRSIQEKVDSGRKSMQLKSS